MKKFLLGIFILMTYTSLNAQFLFDTDLSNLSDLSNEDGVQINKLEAKTNVDEVYSIDIVTDILDSDGISFKVDDEVIVVHLLKKHVRSDENYSWFGETDDGEGVFFYVNNGKYASKFSIGEYAYTLVPLSDNSHALVKFNSTYVGECGTPDVTDTSSILPGNNNLLDDSTCTLRILIATTPAARQEIDDSGFDIPTFAQAAVDEANLAYMRSDIGITMELAVLVETGYTEVLGDNHSTDVANFQNRTDSLKVVDTLREHYRTDIQVLIRRNESGIFGRVAYIPTATVPLDSSRAYCTVSVDGVTDGRHSFTHEIGHLQGARHENDDRNPTYARGYLSSDTTNAWRTIMARTGAAPCTQSNSCRIGVFSNPDINFPQGVPAGTININNAKRIMETATDINNFRKVPDTLLLTETNRQLHMLTERTIDSAEVSNHLAYNIIDTDSLELTYERGSFGTMRAEDRIILRPKTRIETGSKFRAYLAEDPCENEPLPFSRNSQNFADNAFSNEQMDNLTTEALEVQIYPNPTNGTINLQFNTDEQSKYQVKVYDLMGKTLVEAYYEEPSVQLDLNFLSAGFYFFEINKDNIQMIKKIIKK